MVCAIKNDTFVTNMMGYSLLLCLQPQLKHLFASIIYPALDFTVKLCCHIDGRLSHVKEEYLIYVERKTFGMA